VPGSAPCSECPANTHSLAVGATDASVCAPCAADSQSPSGNAFASSCVCNSGFTGAGGGPCVACVAGKYKEITGSADCSNCGAGTFSAAAAATTAGTCALCVEGKFSSALGAVDASTCVACDADTFSPTRGAASSSACQQCPAHTQSVEGSSAAVHCVCRPGYHGPDGGACQACSEGKYKIAAGTAACSDCPEHASSSEASTAKTACLCAAGYETTLGADSVIAACAACTAGKYKAVVGLASGCRLCESDLASSTGVFDSASPYCVCRAGYILDAGTCRACQTGTYKEQQGNSTLGCASFLAGCCECGQFQTTLGAASSVALADCVCMHGHGVQDPNNFACVPCPRGTFKEDLDRQACAPCPANTDTLQVGAFDAQECVSRAGYFMVYDAGGLATASACPGGTYSDHMNATACEECFFGATSPPASESIDACACQHPYSASGEAHDCTCASGFAFT